MPDNVLIIDCETGEQTERPLTPEEEQARDEAAADAAAAAEQAAWDDLYIERDRQLALTDWLFSVPTDTPPDTTGKIELWDADWQMFRQGLRDLPDRTSNPFEPPWPIAPPEPVFSTLPYQQPPEGT